MKHHRPIGIWLVAASSLMIIALVVGDLILVREDRVIPIGYATTRITGPLRPDGTVDYRLALDDIDFRGVTPANNAVIPLLHALGTGKNILGSAKNRRAALRRLGMKALPKRGPYFVRASTFYQSLIQNAKTPAQRAALEKRKGNWPPYQFERTPWRAANHPHVAHWLALNRVAFHWAMVASRKSHYAMPVITSIHRGRRVLSPGRSMWLYPYRLLTDAMAVKAMECLDNKNLSACENILLSVHRLARLEGREPFFISRMAAYGVDEKAWHDDWALAAYGQVAAVQANTYRKALRDLPPMPSLASAANCGQRFRVLDVLTAIASGDMHPTFPIQKPTVVERVTAIAVPVDYAQVAKRLNSWIDQSSKMLKDQDYALQEATAARWWRDQDWAWAHPAFTPTLRFETGFIGSWESAWCSALPVIIWRSVAERRMATLAFALAAYDADHGRYPASLAKLVPQIIQKLPTDPFTDKPLVYRSNGTGYVLASVGPSRQSGHGRHPITLRVHWPKKRAARVPRSTWPPPAQHP
ncbi:MAG: hypothetical protein HKL95_06935 [Phycisphaerae bacterium]|nr:hypothetical protein [Phycisphaerae bacterium]